MASRRDVSGAASPRRLRYIVAAFALLAAVFLLRLVYLQVIVAGTYSAMAEETRTVSFSTTPHRGTIYDRNGIVLAISVEAKTVYANPQEVRDVDTTARQLSVVLEGEKDDYVKLLSQDTQFVYIARQARLEDAEKVEALGLPGIYTIEDTRREYPNGAIGGQVVGYCNVDGEGITGLELQYNDILKGEAGEHALERGGDGTPIPGAVHVDNDAVDGCDIMVSLDLKLQRIVEEQLAAGLPSLMTDEGSAVVMDAETGELLATCSLPYMDPSNMAEAEVGSDQVKPITQAFEPGSVFKTAAVFSILENRAMTPDDEIFCPAVIEADGYKISDVHERGDATFTLREILDQSSNVGVSLSTEKLGFAPYYESLVRYGLCDRTGVDYPGEAKGVMPDFDKWGRITGYNISFGQGVTTTPLALVRFYGALANDGYAVAPHFLLRNLSTGETNVVDTERISDDEEALATMRSMLRSVVTDGTGKAADVEGFEICGKTSTAEIASGGTYRNDAFNLVFLGFIADASRPLVCYVGANEVPATLQTTAIFHGIMANAIELYNVTPESGAN